MRAIIYLCLALLLVVIQLLYGPTTFFDYTPSTSYEINNEYTPDCCVRSWRNKTHQKHLRITIDRENNVVIPRDASEDCLVAQADMHIICLQPSVSFDLGYDRGRTSESGTFIMFNIKTFQGKTSSTGELTIGLLASGMNDYYLRVLSTAGGFTSLATSRVSVGLVQATLGIPTVVSTNETLDISVKPVYVDYQWNQSQPFDWIWDANSAGRVQFTGINLTRTPDLFHATVNVIGTPKQIPECDFNQFSNGLWLANDEPESRMSTVFGNHTWVPNGCVLRDMVVNTSTVMDNHTFPNSTLGQCLEISARRMKIIGDSISRNFWQDWSYFIAATHPSKNFTLMFSEAEKHDDMILQHQCEFGNLVNVSFISCKQCPYYLYEKLPGNFEINTTFAGEIEEFAAAMATQLLPDHCREYETIVLGHGMWNVFKSSFAHVESHLRPALASLAEGCPGHIRNGRIFFLLMSSGTGQVGTRVRPRVYEWSRRVAAIVLEYNIKIVDTFHATDARLLDAGFNQSDGTHWGRIQSGNSTGTVGMSQILSLIQQLCPGQR